MKKFFSFLAAAAMLFAASCSSSDDFEGDPEMPQSENEIWYTSKDSSIVTPYKTDGFGANIISNTYKNGKGIIKFDGNVTTIGESAFWYCTSLTSITIPDNVKSIGEGAFGYCTSLTSITIPDNVKSIGDGAFFECELLSDFYGKYASEDKKCLIVDGVLISFAPYGISGTYAIPDNVTSIGGYAFCGCTSLTSITIPNSVTSIATVAFSFCSSLTSITIPNSITSIGYEAFSYCESLTSVYCKAMAAPKLGLRIFDWCPLAKIYVPMKSVDAYKSADGWKEYADMIDGYNFDE